MASALFIGRFQPVHIGHVAFIESLAQKHEKVIVGIGSAQKHHTLENPFTADERRMMLELSLKNTTNHEIFAIPDVDNYSAWVDHVCKIVPQFNAVYSGNIIVEELFKKKGYEVHSIEKIVDISATQIRNAMIDNSNWQKYIPAGALKVLQEIKGIERIVSLSQKKYNNPPTAVDIIIEAYDAQNGEYAGIVLIERKNPPYQGCWALPGGFQEYGESLEATAIREAEEETRMKVTILDQLKSYSNPDRDPRGHVNAVGFVASAKGIPEGADDAKNAQIFQLDKLPQLAFDHAKRIEEYKQWKASKTST